MANTERNVAIVGTGLIGRAWAAIFARAGWNVRLNDPHIPTLKAAPRLIRDELHALARHGLCSDPDGAVARVSIAASLQEAVMDVEFVQENGPEKVEEKLTIFAQLDKLAPPDALLVSSTRSGPFSWTNSTSTTASARLPATETRAMAISGSAARPWRASACNSSRIRRGAAFNVGICGSLNRTLHPARAKIAAQARPIRPAPTMATLRSVLAILYPIARRSRRLTLI